MPRYGGLYCRAPELHLPFRLAFLPGLALCTALGLGAVLIGDRWSVPSVLVAFAVGLMISLAPLSPRLAPGIGVAGRTVLRLGVGLLGIRLTLGEIGALGVLPIAVAVLVVPCTILLGTWLARRMAFTTAFGVLTSGATAICGAAAAMAIAAVLPKSETSERDTIFAVVGVTTLSTIAMVLYPLLLPLLGLDERAGGVLLGGAIHDVAQVVGAGYAMSPLTGDIAIYTKLLRVALLLPVVLIVAAFIGTTSGAGSGSGRYAVPWFLVLFVVMMVVASSGWLAEIHRGWIAGFSHLCLSIAIVALGARTSIPALIRLGPRAVLLMVLHSCIILALAVAAISILP